jgi:hypothetical protein
MRRKVIHAKNLAAHWPTGGTAIVWLLLDRFHPPGWFQGFAWTMMALVWIAVGYGVFTNDPVDIFKDKP